MGFRLSFSSCWTPETALVAVTQTRSRCKEYRGQEVALYIQLWNGLQPQVPPGRLSVPEPK